MRSRMLLTLALLAIFILPEAALAAEAVRIPFFGPIIPDYNQCPASFGMVLEVVNRLILLAITLVITIVAPVMIAYAGFLMVVEPVKAGGHTKARGILLNLVVGVVIALAGWLIVNALMAVLYNPSDEKWTKRWSEIISTGGIYTCIELKNALNKGPTGAPIAGVTSKSVPTFAGGACSPEAVKAGAFEGGYRLTDAEAKTFACLARWESKCGADRENYSWDKPIAAAGGRASTAFGAFQVTLSGNADCFERKVCLDAAGVDGPLNCQKGFGPKGFTAGGDPKVLEACKRAAANLTCNTAAAACVLKKQGFSAWTGDYKGATEQKKCIATYSGT